MRLRQDVFQLSATLHRFQTAAEVIMTALEAHSLKKEDCVYLEGCRNLLTLELSATPGATLVMTAWTLTRSGLQDPALALQKTYYDMPVTKPDYLCERCDAEPAYFDASYLR